VARGGRGVDTHVDLHLVIDGVGVVLFCFCKQVRAQLKVKKNRKALSLVTLDPEHN
jgi:succinylglutamate desuccinylase